MVNKLLRSTWTLWTATFWTFAYHVQVVDNALKAPGVSDQDLYNRTRGLLLLGAIFKGTIPDESDEEWHELKRCVLLV